jgi:hypothetical protein
VRPYQREERRPCRQHQAAQVLDEGYAAVRLQLREARQGGVGVLRQDDVETLEGAPDAVDPVAAAITIALGVKQLDQVTQIGPMNSMSDTTVAACRRWPFLSSASPQRRI